MKKYRYFILPAIVLAAASTHAALILQDSFSYNPGDLGQVNTGNVWSRTGTGDSIQVVNGSLSYSGIPASAGNRVQWGGDGRISRHDFTAVSSGSLYASFLYRMDNLGALSTTGGAVVGFINAANVSNPNARVYVRKDAADPTAFNFGVLERASAITWSTEKYQPGETYFLVMALDFIAGTNNDQAHLWINPTGSDLGSAVRPQSQLTASGGEDASLVSRFRLVQNPSGGSADLQSVDELRIGTTWAEVTPAIPEPAVIALIGAFGGGMLFVRRVFCS